MRAYLFLLLIQFFFACGESKREKELQHLVDSLSNINGSSGEKMSEYISSIQEVQDNLDAIKERERIITTRTGGNIELDETDVEGINNDINAIHNLIVENKKKLAYLRKKMKNSNEKVSDLQKMVDRYIVEMDEKDAIVADLRTLLEQKDIDINKLDEKIKDLASNIEELETESKEKTEIIDKQDKKINKAYYVIGTKKFLKAKKIVTKRGSFVGIGGITKIHQTSNEFTEIDIRTMTEISLNSSKKIKIYSNHPDNSFDIEKNDKGKYEKFIITNPEMFWKMSKYLVIEIK